MIGRALLAAVVLIASHTVAFAQSTNTDTRTQYPAWLRDSYISFNVGAVDYLFTPQQLQPGFHVDAIETPHTTARAILFGHEFTKYLAVQGSYIRPVKYVSYDNVNGSGNHHHVRVNFGTVTLRPQLPIGAHVELYGEAGLGITSRTGFDVNGVPAVNDAHYATLLTGGGIAYRLNRNWDVEAGVVYSPGKATVNQPRAVLTSAGFRYTMRALPQEVVDTNRESGYIFPRQVIQIEYSSGTGYSVNNFVSKTVPIFWGGNAKVDFGIAPHYERNVFHARKVFALDVGTSAGFYRTRQNGDRFFTASIYPLFRWTFLRTQRADVYFNYSLAGPTYISKIILDGLDTGHHFTFQDFMGIGMFAGKNRNLNVGVKINHYSNGNIFTQNAGVKIPLTFSVGYAF